MSKLNILNPLPQLTEEELIQLEEEVREFDLLREELERSGINA